MLIVFEKYSNLLAKVSQKSDGNMKVWTDSSRAEKNVLENRTKYFSKIGIDSRRLVSAELIHGDGVYKVTKTDGGKIIPAVDALITNSKNIFLSVTVADCLPLFIFDPKRESLGIIHAGWRGLEKNIIAKTIEKLQKYFGSLPGDILVAIGPGICSEHYEVGEEVANNFKEYTGSILRDKGKIFLDIRKVATAQFLAAGVRAQNIEVSSECTFSAAQKYFSYRRDRPEKVQAMIAAFGMRQ